MDLANPLNILLQQGTGYVLFVLACMVIVWQQKRNDEKNQRYEELAEKRHQEALAFKDAFNAAMTQKNETDRIVADKVSDLVSATATIVENMKQLVYRRGDT